MSDIVDRIFATYDGHKTSHIGCGEIAKEAAHEILRLRAEVERLTADRQESALQTVIEIRDNEIALQLREIASLRAEVERLRKFYVDAHAALDKWDDERAELKAEIDRLKIQCEQ